MLAVEIVRRKEQLVDAYRIRKVVFVEEQSVPLEMERDEFDIHATHVVAKLDGRAVGTGRVVILGEDDPTAREEGRWAKVGRMAVLADARRKRVGQDILAMLESAAREAGALGVILHAQKSVEGFYASQGYETEGEPFEEAGIEHVFMRKTF